MECKKSTIREEVVTVVEKPALTITFTYEEATALAVLCGNIGGGASTEDKNSIRKVLTDRLYEVISATLSTNTTDLENYGRDFARFKNNINQFTKLK